MGCECRFVLTFISKMISHKQTPTDMESFPKNIICVSDMLLKIVLQI